MSDPKACISLKRAQAHTLVPPWNLAETFRCMHGDTFFFPSAPTRGLSYAMHRISYHFGECEAQSQISRSLEAWQVSISRYFIDYATPLFFLLRSQRSTHRVPQQLERSQKSCLSPILTFKHFVPVLKACLSPMWMPGTPYLL